MPAPIDRRTILNAAGVAGIASVAGLSACSSGSSSSSTGAAGNATAAGGAVSVAKADVPVGGGKIVGKVVVTQPVAGTFKAFSLSLIHIWARRGACRRGR